MAILKHKKVFKKVLKGAPISQAMREEGYALSTSRSTGHLTKTKGWKELKEKYLPDNDLLKVHKEGLKATKIITSPTEPDKEYPDYAVRHKYLETGYKVKGRLLTLPDFDEEPQYYEEIIQIIRRAYRFDRKDN